MGDEVHTWEVTVLGLVQGVFYRAFTKQAADELKVRGWVRNLSDGSVQAQLQHEDEAQLATLLLRLRHGPPASRVSDMQVTPVEVDEQFTGFEIRRS